MRRFLLSSVLLALALVVVGISLAILRSLHRSILLYVLLIPIWVTVLAVLVKVEWVTLRGNQNVGHQ
jgi:predicted permease